MPESSPELASNALEVSVTELSAKLKRTVEDTFGHVRVRGEISGYRGPHSSGHSYFSLKDDRARLEAVIWRGQASRLKHLPEEGLEVIASGKLTTYAGSSKYQIVIDNLEPAGAGALMALLEERRRKLAAEGLFDDNRKQLLPFLPRVIGVVTSPTGAVIRDILHRISDRFPVHVLVWPVRVQGETSGREVANGIDRLNALAPDGPIPRPDLIIVARGGGSLEDLWGFNDEALVRAAAASHIPLISAVGHETDWTLIDHAADWRAPTPTAAAERAVPVKADLEATLADLGARLRAAVSRLGERRRNELRAAARGLRSPDQLLAMPRRQFDEAAGRLERGLERNVQLARSRFDRAAAKMSPTRLRDQSRILRERFSPVAQRHGRVLPLLLRQKRDGLLQTSQRLRIEPLHQRLQRAASGLATTSGQVDARFADTLARRRERLGALSGLLKSLSYTGVLERGYAVVRNADGVPVKSVAGFVAGDGLSIEMLDGRLDASVQGSARGAGEAPQVAVLPKVSRKSPARTSKTSQNKAPEGQGDLF
ncbi:MAG: exodeoxyribonuclease VII large subunit [Ahrensia sp.]|nr:exodeoxyribonuclease VII large subunit [Ahrensia sp.]